MEDCFRHPQTAAHNNAERVSLQFIPEVKGNCFWTQVHQAMKTESPSESRDPMDSRIEAGTASWVSCFASGTGAELAQNGSVIALEEKKRLDVEAVIQKRMNTPLSFSSPCSPVNPPMTLTPVLTSRATRSS